MIGFLLAAFPAFAAPHPVLLPMRDVTIEYELRPAGQPARDFTVEAEAGGARLFITSPDLPTSFVVDRPAATASVLLPLLRLYTVVKIGEVDPERTVLRGADFTREGHGRIAGLGCTFWHAVSPQGTADGCLTADGVLLQGSAKSDRRGFLGDIRATRVSYGPIDPADFRIPPDFHEAPIRLGPGGMPQ